MRPPLHIVVAALLVATLVTIPSVATPTIPDDTEVETTMLRGPSTVFDDLEDARAVRDARESGTLYDSDVAVTGEVVVLQFQSRELNRSVTDARGANTTERFFTALNATNATAQVVQLNPPTERQAFRVALRESTVRVVRDPATATFWLVLDTTDPTLTTTDGEPLPDREIDSGTELQFEVTVEPGNPAELYAERIRFVAFEALEMEFPGDVTPGEPLYADANSSLRMRGTAPTLPGERVTFRLRARNGTVLESTTGRAESIPDRIATRVDATLPLDALGPDAEFTVEVVARNRTLFERRGVVGAPPTLSNVTAVRFANGSTRVGATVFAPEGGFLYVDAESSGEPVDPVAVPADRRTRVGLVVDGLALDDEVYVVSWWDEDGDGQFGPSGDTPDDPWQVDGDILDATVRVRPATPTPTRSPTATQSPTATVPAPGTTSALTGTDGPGFGVGSVLAALGCLLVVAWLRG